MAGFLAQLAARGLLGGLARLDAAAGGFPASPAGGETLLIDHQDAAVVADGDDPRRLAREVDQMPIARELPVREANVNVM